MGLLSSIESIFPILVLIALGYVLRGRGMFNDTFSGNLSKFILQIALPAGIFVSVIHHLDIAAIWSLRASFLFVLASFILGYVLAYILMKVLNIQRGRKGAFINMVVNDNCLFIGLPVQMALFGEEAFPFFLLYYIMNTLSLWMVGIFLIDADPLLDEDKKPGVAVSWKKLLPPPMIGFIIAIIVLIFSISVAPIITKTLDYLGNMVTPLSLVYIGIVLRDTGLSSIRLNKDTIGGLFGRFIITPMGMIGVLYVGVQYMALPMSSLEFQTYVIQSATPVAAVLPILVNEGKGDLPYATSLVTLSTVLFIIVIPLYMQLLAVLGL